MNTNESIDCLKHISSIHRAQVDERRRYEFKILLTTLTFYVVAVIGKHKLSIDYGGHTALIIISFAILAFASICYLFRIHFANNKNLTFAENAEAKIISLLAGYTNIDFTNIFEYKTGECCFLNSSKASNFYTQSMMIVSFCASSLLFIL